MLHFACKGYHILRHIISCTEGILYSLAVMFILVHAFVNQLCFLEMASSEAQCNQLLRIMLMAGNELTCSWLIDCPA